MTSGRRTNEPSPLEVEPSTAGASGAGDHGRIEISPGAWIEVKEVMPNEPDSVLQHGCSGGHDITGAASAAPQEGIAAPESYRRTNEPSPLEVEGSTAGATAARDLEECEHVYASQHVPGHLLYWVRQCMVCHQVDWDDLDESIRAIQRANWPL